MNLVKHACYAVSFYVYWSILRYTYWFNSKIRMLTLRYICGYFKIHVRSNYEMHVQSYSEMNV